MVFTNIISFQGIGYNPICILIIKISKIEGHDRTASLNSSAEQLKYKVPTIEYTQTTRFY